MNSDIKSILLITSEFPPQPGGIGNHAYYLALYLSKKGYEVHVIADQRDEDNSDEIEFDTSLPFEVKRIKLKRNRWLMYFNRIQLTLNSLKYRDYIIATGKFSLWNVAISSIFKKRPSMAIIHGSEVNLKTKLFRQAVEKSLKSFNTIVAVSNFTKSLISHLNLEVEVIPNGIEVDKWNTTHFENISIKGSPKLVTVGRVSSRKGQLQVIKLLPDLITTYPNIHYHCIGIPTEAENFKNIAQELGVLPHITFHGALNETDLKGMLIDSDIFIMLSMETKEGDVEGFGIAILEANSLGIPAIGALGCGIEDAINNGVSGYLINGKDSNELDKNIQIILGNNKDFHDGSKKWAIQHDWGNIVEKYIRLIK